MQVLVIEDDEDVVDAISISFQIGWPGVELISTAEGKAGVELAESKNPNIIILDLGLPDISGFDVLRQIRRFSNVPIIILTAVAEEDDMIKGLEWGADDYVTKPFRKMELLARVKAILRRQNSSPEECPLSCGSLRYDPPSRKFFQNDREVVLTVTESNILYQLMKKSNQVISYMDLAELVWGDDYPGAGNSLKVHIRHLRKKIESDPSRPQIIINRPGIGYTFITPDSH
ncbi:MAG TPA: response regulator transcription factor [Dehalococcoidales bacterium]|nr:response regulator transcription factor [Dehalococcoidales bacterium]